MDPEFGTLLEAGYNFLPEGSIISRVPSSPPCSGPALTLAVVDPLFGELIEFV